MYGSARFNVLFRVCSIVEIVERAILDSINIEVVMENLAGNHGVINSDAYSDIEIVNHPDRARIEATIEDAKADVYCDMIDPEDDEAILESVYQDMTPLQIANYLKGS